MKLLKKLAILAMALTLCVGAGAALTACGKDKDTSTSSEQTQTATYNVKVVLKDGSTPAIGFKVQLCEKLANGTLGSCEAPVEVNENGVAACKVDPSKKYEIHIMEGATPLDPTEYVTTGDIPANYDGGTITVTVNK